MKNKTEYRLHYIGLDTKRKQIFIHVLKEVEMEARKLLCYNNHMDLGRRRLKNGI